MSMVKQEAFIPDDAVSKAQSHPREYTFICPQCPRKFKTKGKLLESQIFDLKTKQHYNNL